MKSKLLLTAEAQGWIVTDDFHVLKRVSDTEFVVIEANSLSGTDFFVLSKPMHIDLKDNFLGDGNDFSDFDDELSSIVLSFFESQKKFEEAYDGDIEFRNQLLAEMIYESFSELNPRFGKVDKDFAVDYLCDEMEKGNKRRRK